MASSRFLPVSCLERRRNRRQRKLLPSAFQCIFQIAAITPRSAEVKDLSIPIEQLGTPLERYQRITMLHRKPYQMSKNMLNRYFKLFGISIGS